MANLKSSTEPRQPLRVLRYRQGVASELLTRCKYFEVYRMLINTERRQALGLSKEQDAKAEKMIPFELLEKCSILNDMPLAFCVIELVFDANGRGVDFVFRYCNEEMAVVEGIPVSEMLNNSFYEVFKNGDKKWLVTYADVALNGTKVILHDYSPEIGKDLSIYCFQPHPGYCACILIPS